MSQDVFSLSSQFPIDLSRTCQSNKNSKFDKRTKKVFEKLKLVPNLFDLLCESIFSDLCGNIQMKKALVLALFAGTPKFDQDCPEVCTRDHIHVLILGSRCSQKNRYLKCLTRFENSCYIVGNSSSVKLIATRVNNKKNSIEKGVLMCKERELICIDELEKMSRTQQQIIIQSMEHQKIGVKDLYELVFHISNVSIVAAANLNKDEFDYSKTLEQNVRISPDILSKFDLVFLIDELSKQCEEQVYKKEIKRFYKDNDTTSETYDVFTQLQNYNKDIFTTQDDSLLTLEIILKYVSYCYANIHPVINPYLKQVLENFCCNQKMVSSKLRLYETLCRFTEAHAKLYMRHEATEEDFYVILDVVQSSFIFAEKHKHVKKINSKQSLKNMFNILLEATVYYQRKKFSLEEISELFLKYIDPNLTSTQIQTTIDQLNDQALILKRPNFFYEVL